MGDRTAGHRCTHRQKLPRLIPLKATFQLKHLTLVKISITGCSQQIPLAIQQHQLTQLGSRLHQIAQLPDQFRIRLQS